MRIDAYVNAWRGGSFYFYIRIRLGVFMIFFVYLAQLNRYMRVILFERG